MNNHFIGGTTTLGSESFGYSTNQKSIGAAVGKNIYVS
jgi:hypothetical protein